VEGWVSPRRRAVAHAAFASTDALKAALRDHIVATNAAPAPFVWTRSADEILASVARLGRRTRGAARGARTARS
jgi:hypothetical protein